MHRPCAKHPANHLLVQELALLGSLSYFGSTRPCAGPLRGNLFDAAAQLAQSELSFAETKAFQKVPPAYQLEPFPRSVAAYRHRRTVQWLQARRGRHAPLTTPHQPGRAVALFAPFRVPPHLPANASDAIPAEVAYQHGEILQRLFEPYGMQVSTCGMTRRGCPVGKVGEYVVSLTQHATEEVEATVREGEGGGGGGEKTAVHAPRICLTDQLTSFLTPPHPNAALADYRLEDVPSAVVFAAEDVASPSVGYRLQRAIEGIIRSGYVGAGRAPSLYTLLDRKGHSFWVRHDPAQPLEVPPHHHPDIDRLQLHRLSLYFSPWKSFHARRLFLTGPPAFTEYMNLRALAMGFELSLNGLFLVVKNGGGEQKSEKEGTPASTTYKRVWIKSENDIFRLLDLPYVDPINRGIFCESKGLI